MKMFDGLAAVPEKVYVLVFFGVFLVTAFSAYFAWQNADLLERRIAVRQKNLAEVLQLRDTYETKKHELDRYAVKKPDSQAISLALVEGIVAKSFVGGKLSALQPSTSKEEKGSKQTAVELKVTGAALGEIVAFVKATEDTGLRIEKLQLSLPASNPMTLDMQATITERRSHG
jgi:hypothetical protein